MLQGGAERLGQRFFRSHGAAQPGEQHLGVEGRRIGGVQLAERPAVAPLDFGKALKLPLELVVGIAGRQAHSWKRWSRTRLTRAASARLRP